MAKKELFDQEAAFMDLTQKSVIEETFLTIIGREEERRKAKDKEPKAGPIWDEDTQRYI